MAKPRVIWTGYIQYGELVPILYTVKKLATSTHTKTYTINANWPLARLLIWKVKHMKIMHFQQQFSLTTQKRITLNLYQLYTIYHSNEKGKTEPIFNKNKLDKLNTTK
jgi:hypothetical protein